MNKIILANPKINIKDVLRIFKSVLNSNFVNESKKTRQFEKKICKFLNSKYCVTTTSGTTALFLALKAVGIKQNDEVIVPNITFPATANAVKMAGGIPVFVDVNKSNLLIDEKCLLKTITKKTKFLIPVHISGRGSNIKKLVKICKKNSIKIIEDAAEAFGSKLGKINLGNFGEAGCFSLAPNKIITTGQGGIVVTKNKNTYKILKILKDQGRIKSSNNNEDKYKRLGYNFKFTDLQAALGISQLKDIRWRMKKLKKIHKFYLKNIKQNKNFKIIKFDIKKGELPLWTDVWCKDKEKLFNYLKSKNIFCRYYWQPLSLNPVFLNSKKNLKNSIELQKKMMWLPSSLEMTFNQQKKVCYFINLFYSKKFD